MSQHCCVLKWSEFNVWLTANSHLAFELYGANNDYINISHQIWFVAWKWNFWSSCPWCLRGNGVWAMRLWNTRSDGWSKNRQVVIHEEKLLRVGGQSIILLDPGHLNKTFYKNKRSIRQYKSGGGYWIIEEGSC